MSSGINKLTPEQFGVRGDGRSGAGHAEANSKGHPRPEADRSPPSSGRGISTTVPNNGPGGNHYTTGPQEGKNHAPVRRGF